MLPGKNAVLQPLLGNHLCQVLKQAMNQATVNPPVPVTILKLRYVIRIKKHLHNRIETIKIKLNRKEYELLHPYSNVVKFKVKTKY